MIWFLHLWVFSLVLGARVPQGLWDALAWHGYGALLPMPPVIGWLWVALWVAVAFGLYGFSKLVRRAFVVLTVVSLLFALLGGVQVHTAFGSFLLLSVNLADGAILVMAYTSPLKERFA